MSGRYATRAPLIGPCDGPCGVGGRGRIQPCYPVGNGRWLCHACIQRRQSATADRVRLATDGGSEIGPEDVDVGDKVKFEYGKRTRRHRSTKKVREVRDWNVRVEGGGYVSYRDVLEVIPDDGGEQA